MRLPLKVGLIGAGWISGPHAEGWRALGERARVVGVADVNQAAARKLAESLGAEAYADYRALIARGDLDAVDICVPPHLHVEIVTAAAEAGAQVLCEKPLARDLEEAARIGEAVQRSGVIYMPAHNTLFYPSVQRARAYLAHGDLGRLYFARCWECYTDVPPERWAASEVAVPEALRSPAWRASKSLLGGGALADGGYHAVYRLLYLAGSRPAEVTAFTGLFHPGLSWETEDTAIVLVRLGDGSLGEILISYAFEAPTTGADRLFAVSGREGLLAGNEHSLELRLAGWAEPSVQRLSSLQGDSAWRASIAAEIAHFAECVTDKRTPIQTFADARRALQVVRAAYRAVEAKGTVQIE